MSLLRLLRLWHISVSYISLYILYVCVSLDVSTHIFSHVSPRIPDTLATRLETGNEENADWEYMLLFRLRRLLHVLQLVCYILPHVCTPNCVVHVSRISSYMTLPEH